MSLRTRLERLEREIGAGGRCPTCRDWPDNVIRYDAIHQPEGDELDPGEPCPDCGWAPKVTQIVEVIVETREEAARLAREEGTGLLR